MFSSFTSKLSGIISSCLRPVCDSLSHQRGIIAVLCCPSDHDTIMSHDSLSSLPSHHHVHGGGGSSGGGGGGRERLIISQRSTSSHHLNHAAYIKQNKKGTLSSISSIHDPYTILSSHDALLNLASDIMSLYGDHISVLHLTGKTRHIYIQRYHDTRSTLIVLYDNNIQPSIMRTVIEDTAYLLHKVLVMASNLKT